MKTAYSAKSKERVLDIVSQNFCIGITEIARIMDVSKILVYCVLRDLVKSGEISRGEYKYERPSGGQGIKKGFIYE